MSDTEGDFSANGEMEKEYPREVHVEIGGEVRRVYVNLWGLILAEEKGYDIGQLALDEEEAKEQATSGLKNALDLLWIGMLPFNEDLTRKELGMQIPPSDLEKLEGPINQIMSRQFGDDVREKIQEARGEGDEVGKAQANSKPS